MAVYFVTGSLGSGKTLCTVGKIRDYLEAGRRVATNLDLNLEKMLPRESKTTVIRLPDKPRLEDMQMLGYGCPEDVEKEDRYGLIVLDELATWMNSREWRDKERLPVIDWFLHARKWHWDLMLIVQDLDSLDGQLVGALCEHRVVCRRMDRLPIPGVSSLMAVGGVEKIFPKVHFANVFYGRSAGSARVARWWYRGRDLYGAYRTGQKFRDGQELVGGELVDMRASFSYLPPYHTNSVKLIDQLEDRLAQLRGTGSRARTPSGRADSANPFLRQWKTAGLALGLILASLLSYTGVFAKAPAVEVAKPAMEQKPPEVKPVEKPREEKKEVVERKQNNDVWNMLAESELKIRVLSYDADWKLVALRIEARKGEVVRIIDKGQLLLNGVSILLSNQGVELALGGEKIAVSGS